jgi:hypothetical protein
MCLSESKPMHMYDIYVCIILWDMYVFKPEWLLSTLWKQTIFSFPTPSICCPWWQSRMTELGFVRPVVRKKLQAQERMRVYAFRKNFFFLFVLLTLLGMFYGPGIIMYNSWNPNGDRSSPQNENSNAHSRMRGGSRAWISIDSQPFVSATKNHGRVFRRTSCTHRRAFRFAF